MTGDTGWRGLEDCPFCEGAGIQYFDAKCSGCSGIPSPSHEPACGVEPCICTTDDLSLVRHLHRVEKERDEARAELADVREDAALTREELRRVTADRTESCEIHRHTIRDLLHRSNEAEAKVAAVLAVPSCRDVGHTETIHSAAGCCDPYETPCAAYTAALSGPGWSGTAGQPMTDILRWTEQEIRVAFIGGRKIPVYPGPDTEEVAHTFGSLMYQLKRRRDEDSRLAPLLSAVSVPAPTPEPGDR